VASRVATIVRVQAFSASGRLSTMVATREATRSWTVSNSRVVIAGSGRPIAPSGSEHRVVVVALDHADRTRRRRLQAQLAQDALVEVLADDLDPTLAGAVDVDGADIGELGGEAPIARNRWVHLDRDKQTIGRAHTAVPEPSRACTSEGISEISCATTIPASASRAIFLAAVSSLPSTIVPAWPKLIPGISSMKRPAMNATIGSRDSFSST